MEIWIAAIPQMRSAEMRIDSIIRSDLGTRLGSGRNRYTVELPSGFDSESSTYFDDLRLTIAPLRKALLKHSIYSEADSRREFMRIQVFAYRDFRPLAKRVQRDLTYQYLPWTALATRELARSQTRSCLERKAILGRTSPSARLGCEFTYLSGALPRDF